MFWLNDICNDDESRKTRPTFILKRLEMTGENIHWNINRIYSILNKIVTFLEKHDDILPYASMLSKESVSFTRANACYRHLRSFQCC